MPSLIFTEKQISKTNRYNIYKGFNKPIITGFFTIINVSPSSGVYDTLNYIDIEFSDSFDSSTINQSNITFEVI